MRHRMHSLPSISSSAPSPSSANTKRDLLLAFGKENSCAGGDRVFKEDTREMQMVPIGKSKRVGAAMGVLVA